MNDTPGNIKIIVRIRGHETQQTGFNINTLESVNTDKSAYNTRTSPLNLDRNKNTIPTTRSTSITRSKSPLNKRKTTPVISKGKLDESNKYTIFTASSPSNTIVVTPKSISGKLINETFCNTNDLYEYSYSILKNASLLEFDRVYNETHMLETIYNEQLKESVSNLFNGKSSCCMLFGPSEAGKSYTLRGPSDSKSNEYGVFGRVIYDVLNLTELSKQTNLNGNKHKSSVYYVPKISVYQVYLDHVSDLLSNQYHKNLKIEKYFDEESNMMKTQINELTEREIKTKSDYDNFMREAVYNRRSLANYLRINDSKRKSHLVLSVIIERRERINEGYKRSAEKTLGRYAQIDFVELASSNFGLSGQKNQSDFDEVLYKNTSRTFNSICNNVVSASIGLAGKYDTKLTLALKNTLNFNSNIIFISCVLPSEEPPTKSLKCLKFTNWLRNQIYNLQNNRDYKIKSAYEDSEEDVVQRDFNTRSENRYDTRGRFFDKHEDNKLVLESYKDFDNYYNYKRNQRKNYLEDKTADELYEFPQRFSVPSSNYDIGRSVNMNDHHALYDKYQILEREREGENYAICSPISRKDYRYNKPEQEKEEEDYEYQENKRENMKHEFSPKINYNSQVEENIDSDYLDNKPHRSINKSLKHAQSETYNNNNPNYEKDSKLHEVERSLRDLEAKSLEMSRYIEKMKMEKSRINDDSAHSNINIKTSCDCEVDKLKQEASTLKSDNIIFREDINRLTDINRHLEEELARQRNRNLELAADNEKLTQDKIQMRCEIEKLSENNSKVKLHEHGLMEQLNLRFMTENRMRDLEIENKTLRDEKQKYEVDFKVLLERHTEMKKLFEQNENELNFIKIKQGEEVNNIEIKLDKMAKEIELQQRENSQLRLAEERMRGEISNLEKQRDNYRDKYQECKLKNNLLNSKLTEIEDDFRKLIIEKQAEHLEKMKEHETRKMKIDSKQKIIEDMQNRIAGYKAEIFRQRKRKDE